MELIIAFALGSVFIFTGMFLRSKIKLFKNMYVPATVIAGILGCIFINVASSDYTFGIDQSYYANIVGYMFILSFISIGLSSAGESAPRSREEKAKGAKNLIIGSIGMGCIWNILYGLSAVVGFGILYVVGQPFGINPRYGLMIPWGFCEGPGLAVSFGSIFEDLGLENAVSVALTFAATGFLSAFLLGVPIAKFGIKKGLGKYFGKADEAVARGYYKADEQKESLGTATTYSGSLETFTFHIGLMMLIFLVAEQINKLLGMLPGNIGVTLGGLTFMYGLLMAYVVKFVLKKLKIDYLLNNTLQSKITGFLSDFLVVFAFMAVQFATVQKWIVPLLIEIVIVALMTAAVCIFLGQRLGSEYDFERTLGLIGTCCGTAPSGIALIRIIDPKLQSPTPVEMGLMTWIELIYMTWPASIMFGIAGGTMSINTLLIFVAVTTIGMLIVMKMIGALGPKTFSLNLFAKKNTRAL
ncbi:sodium/glutamate symporter [Peptococcus niger]|uniref:Glutamate:Na+ symporter, ESS family n=1 Tax=Peptococcus niger TaxID=2741 RepID=A0A1G7AG38_PEPNI|nr:sodium/glutamate symporter [Peptococcus niger]SDE13720.1 glutamate:Na+ symporter, ESS family [Peptococcus niger]